MWTAWLAKVGQFFIKKSYLFFRIFFPKKYICFVVFWHVFCTIYNEQKQTADMKDKVIEMFYMVDRGELSVRKTEKGFSIEKIDSDKNAHIVKTMCYETFRRYFRQLFGERKSCMFWTKSHETDRLLNF